MADPPITITILGEDRQVVAEKIFAAALKVDAECKSSALAALSWNRQFSPRSIAYRRRTKQRDRLFVLAREIAGE